MLYKGMKVITRRNINFSTHTGGGLRLPKGTVSTVSHVVEDGTVIIRGARHYHWTLQDPKSTNKAGRFWEALKIRGERYAL